MCKLHIYIYFTFVKVLVGDRQYEISLFLPIALPGDEVLSTVLHHQNVISYWRAAIAHASALNVLSDLFFSLDEDEEASHDMRNNVARSPELSGVTYVQGAKGVWGMPHMLEIVSSEHLESAKTIVSTIEECVSEGEQTSNYGEDYAVNVWVGLSGPAVLSGTFCRWLVLGLHRRRLVLPRTVLEALLECRGIACLDNLAC